MDPNERMKFLEAATKFVSGHDKSICAFNDRAFRIEKRIGSSSKYGEVYLVSARAQRGILQAALKLMPIVARNKAEIEYYKRFNAYITNGMNPHFPLVFHSKTCKSCPFQHMPQEDCYITLKELADGDLKMWLTKQHSPAAFCSLWAQTAIAGMGLEKEGVIHNDLHWGNILFHKVKKSNKDKYTYYKLEDHHVYVKNTGEHWVLWDFGRSEKWRPPYESSLQIDMERIAHVAKWASSKHRKHPPEMPDFPKTVKDLYSHVNDYLITTWSTTRYIEFLIFLQRCFNPIDTSVLLIDPPNPPPPSKVINPRAPYVMPSPTLPR
jgi:hypothetical protein